MFFWWFILASGLTAMFANFLFISLSTSPTRAPFTFEHFNQKIFYFYMHLQVDVSRIYKSNYNKIRKIFFLPKYTLTPTQTEFSPTTKSCYWNFQTQSLTKILFQASAFLHPSPFQISFFRFHYYDYLY